MKLNSSGNVAVNGEPNTYDELKVYGNVKATSFIEGSVVGSANITVGTYTITQSSTSNYIRFNGCYGGTPRIGIGKTPSSPYELDVNGEIQCVSVKQTSDGRFKKNINGLSGTSMLEKVKLLNGKSYSFKNSEELEGLYKSGKLKTRIDTFYVKEKKKGVDTLVKKTKMYLPDLPTGVQYGLIAQEVVEVFPELVSQDTTGVYAIDYTGFIPVLLEAVKELQTQNEILQAEITTIQSDCCKKSKLKSATPEDYIRELGIELYQNVPNPFSESTEISYFIPETVANASIFIYNMMGTQLNSYLLNQSGKGSLTIYGGEYQPGMYLYALIADGQIIDTKQMILTDN